MPASTAHPPITLTTDFGQSDHYVGTMKGVLLSRCPGAVVVDITHQIQSFGLVSAAYAIDQAAPYFPAGTVHIVVVDPGVGTARKALVLEANRMLFVAPDNGVLTLIAKRFPDYLAREVTDTGLFLPSPSDTFHGRDIFAPVGAALASGNTAAADVGPELASIQLLPRLETGNQDGAWEGIVLSVDRFGNVITNLPSVDVPAIRTQPFEVQVPGGARVTRFFPTFGAAEPGVPFTYFGSSGYLELGINQQSAAAVLGVAPGAPVKLILSR